MPNPIVRLLIRWYMTQRMRAQWSCRASEYFGISNGVHQGGVLSPVLFTIYLDSLLETLYSCGCGCYWENHFSGALCYADGITILAPSPDALRKMLTICEDLLRLMGLYLMPVRLKLFVSDTLQTRYPPTSHFAVNAFLWLIQSFILEILYSTICVTNWTFNQNR